MQANTSSYAKCAHKYGRSRGRWTVAASGVIMVMGLTSVADGRITINGDLEWLRQVSAAHQSNRQQLQTWRGSAQFEHREYDGRPTTDNGEADYIRTSSISFVQTRSKLRSHWNDEEVKYRPADPGLKVSTDPRFYNQMKLDDGTYHYRGLIEGDGHGQLVIAPANERRSYESINPMSLLEKDSVGQEFEKLLNHICDGIAKAAEAGIETPQDSRINITRKGDLIELDMFVDRGDKGLMYDRITFDLAQGGNVVQRDRQLPTGDTTIKITYQEKDGVWIPQSYSEDQEGKKGSSQDRSWKKRISFTSESFNQPIGDDEFTLVALGVKPGDFVTDRRQPESSVSFRYTGEGGMPEEELARFVGALTGDIPESQPAAEVAVASEGPEPPEASEASPLALSVPTDVRGRSASLMTVIVVGVVAVVMMIAIAWLVRRARTTGEEQA